MKLKGYLTIIFILLGTTGVAAQSFNLKDIDTQLNKIYDDDQQVRTDWGASSYAEMHAVDSCNQQYVSHLLDDYGWPDSLSEKTNKAIWYVIDHADNPFSEKYLPLVQKKGTQGILQMSDVVTLEDRILMRNSKKQIYGTQTVGVFYVSHTGEKTGTLYVWPIEDDEKVDELRASVGLPPMKQYIQEVENRTGTKVLWDKNLTIDELKEKIPWLFSK